MSHINKPPIKNLEISNCDSTCIAAPLLKDEEVQIHITVNFKLKQETQKTESGFLISCNRLTSDELYDKYKDYMTKEHVRNLYRNNE